MADNVAITAGTGTTIAADDVGGVLHQRVKVALGADGSATDAVGGAGAVSSAVQRTTLASDDPAVASLSVMDDWDSTDAAKVVGLSAIVSANFTRPSDTTAYASGDLVANSTTAGSVVALSWSTAGRVAGNPAFITRARLKTSSTVLTNASFRLHLYAADPTASTGITNGDNGAWLTKIASYLGCIDIIVDKAFSDAAAGQGAPSIGNMIAFVPGSGTTIYGLLEARAAYTPTSAEVLTVELEIAGQT